MSEPTLQAQIDAANAYEALFVPALFGQWAPRVADAAQIRPGQRVLDVACGTGVLAREVTLRIGSSGRVAGIDPSPGMVAVAKQFAPAVEWREGVAESLPVP
jgi:ubiquinone/menaquinone biosynthesis C-methylase UbiE